MNQHYLQPDGLPPVSGYSPVVAFSGRMVAVSGQVPLDRHGTLVGRDDPWAQLKQVFDNLSAALAAAGAGMVEAAQARHCDATGVAGGSRLPG
jgi:enamine deaminase RidA (YjgF/YER057c/UK114 family)